LLFKFFGQLGKFLSGNYLKTSVAASRGLSVKLSHPPTLIGSPNTFSQSRLRTVEIAEKTDKTVKLGTILNKDHATSPPNQLKTKTRHCKISLTSN
jgi:hypothetical protein